MGRRPPRCPQYFSALRFFSCWEGRELRLRNPDVRAGVGRPQEWRGKVATRVVTRRDFFLWGGHPCPAKPLYFPGRIMCPAPLWFCISNHWKKCRLKNFCIFVFRRFCTDFFGRFLCDWAEFIFFAVFRRCLVDFATFSIVMVQLKNNEKWSENRKKKRVKMVRKPHKIKFFIDKNYTNYFLSFFDFFLLQKNTIITHYEPDTGGPMALHSIFLTSYHNRKNRK